MTLRRIFTTMLILAVLLTTIAGAIAEANKYSRFDNPGKGHDWEWDGFDPSDTYFNENVNDNKHHNDNGYLNHLPHGEVIPS